MCERSGATAAQSVKEHGDGGEAGSLAEHGRYDGELSRRLKPAKMKWTEGNHYSVRALRDGQATLKRCSTLWIEANF